MVDDSDETLLEEGFMTHFLELSVSREEKETYRINSVGKCFPYINLRFETNDIIIIIRPVRL